MSRNIKEDFKSLKRRIKKELLSGNFFLKEYKNSVASINCHGLSLTYQVVENYFELFLYGDIDLDLNNKEGKSLMKRIEEKSKQL